MSTHEIEFNGSSLKNENLKKFSWKEFFILTAAGLFGGITSLPAVWTSVEETARRAEIPVQLLLGSQIVQSAILMLLAVGLGLLLSSKTGLGAPILRGYLDGEAVGEKFRSHILSSISLGVLGAIAAKILDAWLFIPNMPGFSSVISQTSGWKGILASFYGGITEEILSRLFFLTLLAWILSWLTRTGSQNPSPTVVWLAILGSAIIFGLGHLPATLMTNQFSLMILARALVLNGIPGIIFGYLYWKRGLEFSMMAHFSADLIVHAILPLLSV